MQRSNLTTRIRTVGLLLGATLFIFMVVRSGQNASSKIAVQGKPSLVPAGQQLTAANKYAALTLADASAAPNTVDDGISSSNTNVPGHTNHSPEVAKDSVKQVAKPATAIDNSLVKHASKVTH